MTPSQISVRHRTGHAGPEHLLCRAVDRTVPPLWDTGRNSAVEVRAENANRRSMLDGASDRRAGPCLPTQPRRASRSPFSNSASIPPSEPQCLGRDRHLPSSWGAACRPRPDPPLSGETPTQGRIPLRLRPVRMRAGCAPYVLASRIDRGDDARPLRTASDGNSLLRRGSGGRRFGRPSRWLPSGSGRPAPPPPAAPAPGRARST
jgi:hypothetical protein